ncbi:MAG: hypothetical protein IJB99_09465 [Clostridia bacterium]|nr:hypothetical protein [Clostridia bacterium]
MATLTADSKRRLFAETPIPKALLTLAIPTVINHKDAVFNVSRIALLLKAFETADEALFSVALNDRLHQPYREHLIDDYKTVRLNALGCGALGLYLSGAGPTLIAVYSDNAFPERVQKLISGIRNEWIVKPLDVDRQGAVIEEM